MSNIIQIGSYPLSEKLISGGIEASVYGLANEQSKTQAVFVFDFPRKNIEDFVENKDNLTVFRYKNTGSHNKDAVRRIPEIVEKIMQLNPYVCHIHGTGIFSCMIFEALKQKGVPLMLTVHGLVKEEKRKALKNRYSLKTLYQYWSQTSAEKKLLQSAPGIIVDTQYVAKQIDQYSLTSRPKVSVIPQGIDEQFFNVSCSSCSKTILSVGAFSQRKGHLLLIKAFEKIASYIPDASLTIGGVVSENAYYNEVIDYVNASPVKDRISILTNLPKEQLLAQYEKAHVFALHSQEESQGIVFAEAMAAGLPIVATNVGGVPYVIEHGVTGFLSKYGDVDAFASSLEHLLTDEEEWTNMSAAGKSAAKQYAWNSIAHNIEIAYA